MTKYVVLYWDTKEQTYKSRGIWARSEDSALQKAREVCGNHTTHHMLDKSGRAIELLNS